MPSELEAALAFQIKALKLTAPEREWRFARQIVGGGKGIRDKLKRAGLKDFEKYHVAQYHGWTIYRTDRDHIKNGEAVRLIQQQINTIRIKSLC